MTKLQPSQLVITTALQPKHVLEISDDHSPDQLSEILKADPKTRDMILTAINIYAAKYLKPRDYAFPSSPN